MDILGDRGDEIKLVLYRLGETDSRQTEETDDRQGNDNVTVPHTAFHSLPPFVHARKMLLSVRRRQPFPLFIHTASLIGGAFRSLRGPFSSQFLASLFNPKRKRMSS
jgi:hypothetical protein